MEKQQKPRQATLALRAHAQLFGALRALLGDVEQVSPAPVVELDPQTRAELADIADRLRRVVARLHTSKD